MIIGISGKKQCGKDTIYTIIRAIDIYYNSDIKGLDSIDFLDFVKGCIEYGRLVTLQLYKDIKSKWEKHAFADILKQSLGIILDVPASRFENNNFKESESIVNHPDREGLYTNRELLQKFGTEVGRSISPNLWVDVLLTKYTWVNESEEPFWVITDVRFPSEAQAVKERGGILIRVNRDTGYNDTHESEIALDDYAGFDYVINNCDLEGTIMKVENIMRDNNLI